jgi:Heterokaryon incompatibility protein (HET)
VAHSIQANLFEFLQQLRLTYAAVSLWVDALSINQSDILEKNMQIPLMGLIYSYVKSVLVWIGPQADGSEEYFDSCNQIPSESQSLRSSGLKNVDSDATNPAQPPLHLSNAAPIGREPGSSKKLSWLPTPTSSVATDSHIGLTSSFTCQIMTLTTGQLA